MTLIAVHARPDRAQVVTDELVYTPTGRYAEPDPAAPKAVALPELTAVTACSGDVAMARRWHEVAAEHAARCDDLDDFVRTFPQTFEATFGPGEVMHTLAAWVAGYSPRRGRCVAWETTNRMWFVLRDASDRLNLMPALPGFRPTRVEQLVRKHRCLPPLAGEVPYPPPEDDDEWADLAEDVHQARAETLDGDLKVLMGGAVTLLEVTADGIERREVHRFTGDDRDRMLRGTIHPSQQLGPCVCGSGARMLECHFREVADRPCLCRSGRTFATCCMVTPLEDLADDPHAPLDVSDRHPSR